MSEFENVTGSVNKVLNDYENMMKEVRNTLQEKMKEVFKAFFDTHPEVKTIHWTQYTPHFNDGDECVFSVNEPYFTKTSYKDLNERDNAWGEEDVGIIGTTRWDSELRKYVDNILNPVLVKDMNTLSNIIQSDANEAVMQAMFGNHVWVKAHAGGFYVDEFDHD